MRWPLWGLRIFPAGLPLLLRQNPHQMHIARASSSKSSIFGNIPPSVWEKVHRNLHRDRGHPLGIVTKLLEDYFSLHSHDKLPPNLEVSLGEDANLRSPNWKKAERPSWKEDASLSQLETPKDFTLYPKSPQKPSNITKNFTVLSDFSPVVPAARNFDDLLIPLDHPSRKASDTFYLDLENPQEMLKTHATAHQVELLKKGYDAVIWSSPVARKDSIDAFHYPVFHQMDGYYLWDEAALSQLGIYLKSVVELDPQLYSRLYGQDNPHREDPLMLHLQFLLEGLVDYLFGKKTQRRWDYSETFPFTDPSLELEVFEDWDTPRGKRGKWVELLGCGAIKTSILRDRCGLPEGIRGWAFGMGIERITMLLLGIPDIRYFWTEDPRFLDQFKGVFETSKQSPQGKNVFPPRFKPYSRYPPVTKDISIWCEEGFEDNDFYVAIRELAADCLENVKLIDVYEELKQPGDAGKAAEKARRISKCFRLTYRGINQNLTHQEVNVMQEELLKKLQPVLPITLR